jgi:hypothetical protein
LVEDPKDVGTNLKSLSTNPQSQGEGSLVKSGEGIQPLPSGGRYCLLSSASQEKRSPSVLLAGIGALSGLKPSGVLQFHVNVNSWLLKEEGWMSPRLLNI